jgi:hypothetical protein
MLLNGPIALDQVAIKLVPPRVLRILGDYLLAKPAETPFANDVLISFSENDEDEEDDEDDEDDVDEEEDEYNDEGEPEKKNGVKRKFKPQLMGSLRQTTIHTDEASAAINLSNEVC